MVCSGCNYEYRDDARFCPRCGKAKPDDFSKENAEQNQASGSYFDQGAGQSSAYSNPQSSHTKTENNAKENQRPDVPFFVDSRKPNTQYRPSSFDTNAAGTNNQGTAQTQTEQQYRQDGQYQERHQHQSGTRFDDESIRRFLVGFGFVAVAVVVLVVALVIISGG